MFNVFQQQIAIVFNHSLVFFSGLATYTVSHFIDYDVKLGHYMRQIEYDFDSKHFF